jgi:hypothetical protein
MKEISIKQVSNGYVVRFEHDVDGEFTDESFVFTKYSQVVKFLRENLNGKVSAE